MKAPPLLLGAALLFWGWQTGFLIAGAMMAVVLESARLIKTRWEFSDEDFSRVWTLCTLLFLAVAIYAFTINDGPSNIGGWLQDPNLNSQRNVGTTSARTASLMIRWLPMVFFLFIAAQLYSMREEVSLATISLIIRRRQKQAQKLAEPLPDKRNVNVSYPYFIVCLLAASLHTSDNSSYFWGLCALLGWALWSQRPRRFSLLLWAAVMAAVVVAGYSGERGLLRLQGLVQNYNPQWLSRFTRQKFDPTQSVTAIGQIGQIKTSGKIVIRLEPKEGSKPPAYLREASYRGYHSQTWHAGSSKDDFQNVNHATNETTWPLLPGKTNGAAVNIACYLDGGKALLPLPAGSGQLENLGAYILQKNSAGAVLAEGPGLVVFDARYGPGATIDSPPAAGSGTNTSEDLTVPLREVPALERVISDLKLSGQNPEQVMRTINGFFQSEFAYSLWQGPDKLRSTNETPLGRFLLRNRHGHCEYFATATVLLLRQLKIPARYAVGYAVHEVSGSKYVVRQRDAHAWCLVWNESNGLWEDFDTTPASWVQAERNRASPFELLSDLWSRIGFEFSKLRWGQNQLRQYLLWILLPALLILLYQIIFRRRQRRTRGKPEKSTVEIRWPGLDSEFYLLERKLNERGMERLASEPLSGWVKRATADPGLAKVRVVLLAAASLHYRYRFDPRGLNEFDREQLNCQVQACLASLVVGKSVGSENATLALTRNGKN